MSKYKEYKQLNLPDIASDVFAAEGQSGMLGMQTHPDFPNTPYVYVALTYYPDLSTSIRLAVLRLKYNAAADALEKDWGRHQAETRTISGVYGSAYEGDQDFADIQKNVEAFAVEAGRRPRMLVAKMGQDGHDRGAKVVATGYADLGFDVDIGPLFQTPAETAKQAVENDVHILGVSSLAAGHKTLVPEVIQALKAFGREDIMVIVGGVVPKQDHEALYQAGVVAIYGPGTKLSQAAIDLLTILMDTTS